MVRSLKKIFSLLLVIIGLSSSFALPMVSRLANRGSAASRAAAIASARRTRPSLARRLLPNPTLKTPLSDASQVQIQPESVVVYEPQEVTPAKPVKAKIEPKKSVSVRAEAQKKPVQIAQPQVQATQPEIQKAQDRTFVEKVQKESMNDILDIILKRYGESAQKSVQAKDAGTQAKVTPAVKARAVYNNAMKALNPVLDILKRLQDVSPNIPEYAQLHNQMRQALITARKKGYSIGFVDKAVIQKAGDLPGTQIKLLKNQPGAGAMIIPAQALSVVGMAQASGLGRVLGLQGDFVPFIAPIKSAFGNDAVFEIVRSSLKNPSHIDHSKIIIEPIGQLMPPADNADMRLIELPEEAQAGNGVNNNGLQANDGNHNQKPPVIHGIPNAHDGASVPSAKNVMRHLGGISSAKDENEAEELEMEKGVVPAIQEPEEIEPKKHQDEGSSQSRKIGSQKKLSEEESVIDQYGNLILQALIARTYLHMQWAGKSRLLQAMFIDYNALLTHYRTINDPFSNAKYTDSNQRIYQVVSMVLEGLKSAKN